MFYFCDLEEFLMFLCTGFVLIYKGKIVFEDLDEGNVILYWVYDTEDKTYLYKTALPVLGHVKFLNLNEIL